MVASRQDFGEDYTPFLPAGHVQRLGGAHCVLDAGVEGTLYRSRAATEKRLIGN
jgi:hypothetical protein